MEKQKTYSERLELAKIATFPGEELKEENFNRVNTDGFEKAIVTFKKWFEMTLEAMQKHKSFRIEITYNAEASKSDFCIYTPIEDGTGGNRQEHSET